MASSPGSAHTVWTPADVSSLKYVKGGFCIFLSPPLEPIVFRVTEWPCAARVFASQKPMLAWPPPLVLTMSTFWGATAAEMTAGIARCGRLRVIVSEETVESDRGRGSGRTLATRALRPEARRI